jgi:HSP20 family protein
VPDFNKAAATISISARCDVTNRRSADASGDLLHDLAASNEGLGVAATPHEMDRLFDDFNSGFWRGSLFDMAPFRRAEAAFRTMPAVDVAESDKADEITAELPGLDEKNIEVKLANGVLSIKGEKQEEKEEKRKDYYRRERSFGSFERSFQVPEGIDTNKIAASFKNGILSVTLPKSAEAQKQATKIEVKAV